MRLACWKWPRLAKSSLDLDPEQRDASSTNQPSEAKPTEPTYPASHLGGDVWRCAALNQHLPIHATESNQVLVMRGEVIYSVHSVTLYDLLWPTWSVHSMSSIGIGSNNIMDCHGQKETNLIIPLSRET